MRKLRMKFSLEVLYFEKAARDHGETAAFELIFIY